MITPNLDVRRHEVWNLRIGAAEHYVFSRTFYVVVDDVIRPGTVPSAYCLRVCGDSMDVGDVRVDYRGFSAVQADSPLKLLRCEAVNPQTIEDQMMRHARK